MSIHLKKDSTSEWEPKWKEIDYPEELVDDDLRKDLIFKKLVQFCSIPCAEPKILHQLKVLIDPSHKKYSDAEVRLCKKLSLHLWLADESKNRMTMKKVIQVITPWLAKVSTVLRNVNAYQDCFPSIHTKELENGLRELVEKEHFLPGQMLLVDAHWKILTESYIEKLDQELAANWESKWVKIDYPKELVDDNLRKDPMFKKLVQFCSISCAEPKILNQLKVLIEPSHKKYSDAEVRLCKKLSLHFWLVDKSKKQMTMKKVIEVITPWLAEVSTVLRGDINDYQDCFPSIHTKELEHEPRELVEKEHFIPGQMLLVDDDWEILTESYIEELDQKWAASCAEPFYGIITDTNSNSPVKKEVCNLEEWLNDSGRESPHSYSSIASSVKDSSEDSFDHLV